MKPSESFFRPRALNAEQRTAAEKFAALNAFVSHRNAWITSPPGEKIMRLECLPSSTLADDLREGVAFRWHGRTWEFQFHVIPDGEGQRILSTAIVERFTRNSRGELEPLIEGSTLPVTTLTHAGIVKVERFEAFAPISRAEDLKTIR